MAEALPAYLSLNGGPSAVVTVGALLTLLNVFLRPILRVITLPLKLFATILALAIVNGIFIWVVTVVVGRMDPAVVTLEIRGGIGGWIVVALWFGMGNWLLRALLK